MTSTNKRTPRRRWPSLAGVAGLCVLVGLGAVFGACFVGTSYEKVGSGGAGGAGGGACQVPPGACDQGAVVQLAGSGDVEVTDVARVANSSIVLVGRFRGTLSVAGQQLVAGTGTDGFLLELDNGGNYLAHLLLPEVDENSDLRVAVDPTSTDVVIGGTFTQGPVGNCTSARGVFVRRLGYDAMAGYTSRFNLMDLVCVDAGASTVVAVSDVGVYPDTPYINLVGSFNGMLGGATSAGVDGFTISIDPLGVPEAPFVVGGAGDARIAGALPSYDHNEWVLVGDFSGELSVSVPNKPADVRTAQGSRDLFVIAYDTFPDDSNLVVSSFGAAGADHRAVGVSYIPSATDRAVMLAELDGPIFIDQTINPQGGPAAMALTFQVPVDSNSTPFAVEDIHLLRAQALTALAVGGNADKFFVVGHARGTVTIEDRESTIGEIGAAGCQLDAFVVGLQGAVVTQEQRCGDGLQQVVAVSARQGGSVIAIQVPADSALDAGQGPVSVDTGTDTFLLLQ